MADETISTVAAAPRPEASPPLSCRSPCSPRLAATGTLATNILLPSLPEMAASLKVSTASVTSAITVFLAVFAIGQLVVGPVSDRYGRRWPVLTGFAVFLAGSLWCALANDLPSLLTGRVIQAAGACATSVLSRAIARDLFSGAALARAMALIMIAMAAAPGFSPLLGGALDHYFGWRSGFAFVGLFAALGAIAYGAVFGETHRSTRIPLDPLAIARTYLGLSTDRRFLIPAATVGLIMGGLFAMFSAAPRVLIEGLGFTPDPARAVLRGHRHDRVRRRHAGHAAGAAFRARPLDPRRPGCGCRRQHRHPAGRELPRDVPAVPGRHVRLSARHGHRQSARHGASAVPVRRKGGCRVGTARLLADDGGGDRGLSGGDGLARGDVRARHRADGGLAAGGRALYATQQEPADGISDRPGSAPTYASAPSASRCRGSPTRRAGHATPSRRGRSPAASRCRRSPHRACRVRCST